MLDPDTSDQARDLIRLASGAVEKDINDISGLNRIKVKLKNSKLDDPHLLGITATLCVLTDDRKNWDCTVKRLGRRVDPSMGFYSFNFMLEQKPSLKRQNDWFFIVQQSASLDYLLAKKLVFDKSLENWGAWAVPLKLFYRAFLSCRTFLIAWKNVRDPRLPYSARLQGKSSK